MKILRITDFRAGRNTTLNQLLIPDNACVSVSKNIWAPRGSLTKTPGVTSAVDMTATGTTLTSLYADNTVNTGLSYYARISSAGQSGYYFLWGNAITPLGYVTGTISCSGGSLVSATGNGTSWSTHVSAGDYLRINTTAQKWYEVSSVEDNTHLTLATPLSFAVATGTASTQYIIMTKMNRVENQYASLNGSLWMSDIASQMQRYDSTGTTRIPTGPSAAYLSTHKNYLFGFRTSTAGSRLYWSAIKDPTSWPTNNFIDIDKDTGVGVGMKSYGNELILFKNRSMYKLVGEVFDPSNPTFAVYPIATPPDFSFSANRSCCIHNGILYFVGQNGIYAYTQGGTSVSRVSDSIINDLPPFYGTDSDTTANSQRISTTSYDGNLIIKGLLGISNYYSLFMDRNGGWWSVDNVANEIGSNSAFGTVPAIVVPTSSTRPSMFTGSASFPSIFAWDFPNANSTAASTQYVDPTAGTVGAINAKWRSKEFNLDYAYINKIVVYLAKKSSGSLTVSWSVDQGSFISTTIDMTAGRGGNLIRRTIPIGQKGSTFQIDLSNTQASTNFEVFAVSIYYEEILEDRKS